MHPFIERFSNVLTAVLHGADRIVMKGAFRPLQYADGAMAFFQRIGVRYKDAKSWALEKSRQVFADAEALAITQTGRKIESFGSYRERKEAMAHQRQLDLNKADGLIGVWTCQETARSYRSIYNPDGPFPRLAHITPRINHLYFYFDHPEWGFCSVRFQPWFPYHIQFAFHGREFLRRGLEQKRIEFIREGNKFLHIDEPETAQHILDQQYQTPWNSLLNSFLPTVFPALQDILGDRLSYAWTFWQSEWATDYIFKSPDDLKPLMDNIVRHALFTGTGERLLRYFSRPVRLDGQPYAGSNPEIMTRISKWEEGVCIRHWVNGNSAKLYNFLNNLRAETTMNFPGQFKIFRHKEGQPNDGPKQRMPMRKGIADASVRGQVSKQINDRFMNQIATFEDRSPAHKVLDPFTRPFTSQGRRVRALDLLGKDRALLEALSDPKYALSGVTNKMLRDVLRGTAWAKGGTDKQLSARISRHLRLLRQHGILKKVPKQHKYLLQPKGHQLTTTLSALLHATTKSLIEAA